MNFEDRTIRILFFLGSLRAGGKERRLIELLTYLKKRDNYEPLVVCTDNVVDFPSFYDLDIPYTVLSKSFSKYDPTIFYKFFRICKELKPDVIHTWGAVQSLYALPTVIVQRIPLVNSQITSAPPESARNVFSKAIDKANFRFSNLIIANSNAGLRAYQPPLKKSQVIYNGINLNRFENLPDKEAMKAKYNIHTPFAVAMVASISPNKDYARFVKVAEKVIATRKDITFLCIGGYFEGDEKYKSLLDLTETKTGIVYTGVIDEVEALINACDIGVLFSNKAVHGEGISNSIMEYMALGKPVIANNAGGTEEILQDKVSGYLINDEGINELAQLVIDLLDDKAKMNRFGNKGREIIEKVFSLNKMGEKFEQSYREVLGLETRTSMKRKLAKNVEVNC